MYRILVKSRTPQLHTIFKARLKQYGFIKVGEREYESDHTVDDIEGVKFYKTRFEGDASPLIVTSQRTGRIV